MCLALFFVFFHSREKKVLSCFWSQFIFAIHFCSFWAPHASEWVGINIKNRFGKQHWNGMRIRIFEFLPMHFNNFSWSAKEIVRAIAKANYPNFCISVALPLMSSSSKRTSTQLIMLLWFAQFANPSRVCCDNFGKKN